MFINPGKVTFETQGISSNVDRPVSVQRPRLQSLHSSQTEAINTGTRLYPAVFGCLCPQSELQPQMNKRSDAGGPQRDRDLMPQGAFRRSPVPFLPAWWLRSDCDLSSYFQRIKLFLTFLVCPKLINHDNKLELPFIYA